MTNPTRWAIIIFLNGITMGVLGHYLPWEASGFIVPTLSFAFAVIGAASISDEKRWAKEKP